MKTVLALAAFLLLAVTAGLLVWEWPKESAPRFVGLELEAGDPLPGMGVLMLAAGVTAYNGSTLRRPARALYIVGNERAVDTGSGELASSVAVHLPTGPATNDPDLLADHLARARFRVDAEGFLESLEVHGRDEVAGRLFSIRTKGTRGEGPDRRLTLELETWTPGVAP